ncbi:GLUT4 regulating protein TUG-domain-containing protein [Lasiosphaeria ovina]|uniref:GLUT4 regulating protein TUG-domain-containing protein n=1 Tax=Lasiosphaeria ovina TaxID=92902 RepID=A0AAE0NKF7_9PEZI|nr:GLUT4 regulating protein TUG-domain-containing protein [Lasiosphaeria ovina]
MSAHVEVVSSDFRRVKVKVSPGTHLVDVLTEACKKLNLNADKYLFKHKQKAVDLSAPFRTSGLVTGAKLELVLKSSSPSVVSIALDVVGRRLTKKLPSHMTLWQVMRQFETAEKDLNITGRGSPKPNSGNSGSGQLYYEAPVVNILGKEYSALEDLQKTLSQCGINSGSIVLRVAFRNSDKTLYEAMEEISGYLKDVAPVETEKQEETTAPALSVSEGPKPGGALARPMTQPEAAPAPEATSTEETKPKTTTTATEPSAPVESSAPAESNVAGDAMDIDEPSTTATAVGRIQLDGVFSAPSSSTPIAAQIFEEESVYEPTIAHAQLRQQQLNARSQNTRLKSDAELAAAAAQEAAKLAKITTVHIKVRFPDQTSAQWVIGREETGTVFYEAVRGVMAHPNEPFKLIMSGTKTFIQEDGKPLITNYRLKSHELLNLMWEDEASSEARNAAFLKSSVASKAQAVVVPKVPKETEEQEGTAGPSTIPAKSEKNSGSGLDGFPKKLPKWMKLPGRK